MHTFNVLKNELFNYTTYFEVCWPLPWPSVQPLLGCQSGEYGCARACVCNVW